MKQMSRVFLFCSLITVLLLSQLLQATPNAALWERTVLLGFDEQSYYCLTTKRNQPGSHYQDTDSLFLSHYDNDGKLIKSTLIRQIHNTIEQDDEGKFTAKHKDKAVKAFDFQAVLQKNKVQLAFPSTRMDYFEVSFEPKGMFIKRHKRKELLLKAAYLENYFNHYKDLLSDNYKLVSFYEGPHYKTAYFLIQNGLGASDADLSQKIVPVKITEIEKIFDKSFYLSRE